MLAEDVVDIHSLGWFLAGLALVVIIGTTLAFKIFSNWGEKQNREHKDDR
jgi:hypothetical protein